MKQAPHRSVSYTPPNRAAEYRDLRVRIQILRAAEETALAAMDHLWMTMVDAERAEVEADLGQVTT